MKNKKQSIFLVALLSIFLLMVPMKAYGEDELLETTMGTEVFDSNDDVPDIDPRIVAKTNLDQNVGSRVIKSDLTNYNTWLPADVTSNVFNFTSATTIEPFGNKAVAWDDTTFVKILYANNKQGSAGFWYRNVGKYNGQAFDIKVTLMDYKYSVASGTDSAMKVHRKRFRVDFLGMYETKFKYEFYKAGTSQKISIKSILTFGDIDYTEQLALPNFDSSNISQTYVHKNCQLVYGLVKPAKTELRLIDDGGDAQFENTPEAFATISFEGTEINFSYEREKRTFNFNWPSLTTSSGQYTYIVMDTSATPHQVAPIKKTVSDSDESDKTANTLKDSKEDYTYHFRTSIDQERQEWWYKSYEMVDDLPAGIKLKNTSSVKVYDELTNADITSEFTVSYTESSRRLSIKAKNCQRTDFYGRNLLVNVPVTVTDTSVMTRDDSPSETRVYVNNKVNLNVTTFDSKARTQTSATVKTYIPIKGKIKIIKVDDKNNDRLADAVFDIAKTASGGNVVSSNVKTNANGEFLTGDLPVGDYYVKEIQPPLGYQTITETWEKVTVKDQETAEITFKNKQTLLHVRQVVLKAHNELVKPTVGYFQLQQVNASNQKNGLYQLVGNSSEINTSSAVTQSLFTTVQLPINKEKLEVSLIIPEYYRYVGVTSTNSGTNLGMFHVSGGPTFDPSSQPITVNYTTSSGYWISIFIEPKFGTNHAGDAEDAPRPYSWESLINDFGNIKF